MLLVLAAGHSAHSTAVLLPPLGVVLARNAGRDPSRCLVCGYARHVPKSVVTLMHQTITHDLPVIASEGWNEVAVLVR